MQYFSIDRGRAALAGATLILVTGCNTIFGLDEVSKRAPDGSSSGDGGAMGTSATSGPGSGGAGGAGGATGAGSMSSATGAGGAIGAGGAGGATGAGGSTGSCLSPDMSDNLLDNGSFELGSSGWILEGGSSSFAVEPSMDCSLACGSMIGHMSGKTSMGIDTGLVRQTVTHDIELGGSLYVDARYTSTGNAKPYLFLLAGGYPINPTSIKGQGGAIKLVSHVAVPLLDARRTGETFALALYQDTGPTGSDMLMDCLSVSYEPPMGAEIISDGWFKGGFTNQWTGQNGASIAFNANDGLCSAGAGVVHIDLGNPSASNAEIRSKAAQNVAAGSKFIFGGATRPLPLANPASFFGELAIHIFYASDGDNQTPDETSVNATPTVDQQEWTGYYGYAEALAGRTITSVWLYQRVSYMSGPTPPEILVDCYSLRVLPP